VTVLNGHIHQVMQKVEGSVTFHTALSTAFPQPAPGTAKTPGPMKAPDDKRRSVLGTTDVKAVMKTKVWPLSIPLLLRRVWLVGPEEIAMLH
jgi:hypothetical protein